MKKWWMILVGALVIFAALSVLKDVIVKVSVEGAVEFVTGLKLRIGDFHVGMLRPVVHIRGLTVYNPRQFPDRVMVDMPEIYVNYDLGAILRQEIHLREVRLDLREFVVVKNRNGELNLNSLKVVKTQKEAKRGGGVPKEAGAPKIRIDDLRLKIGKAVYKDYSAGPAPSVKEFNINIDERYTNITNPYSLVSLIVVKALKNTTISGLTNFDINGLTNTISDTLSKVQGVTTQARQMVNGAQGVVRDATKGLSGMIGGK